MTAVMLTAKLTAKIAAKPTSTLTSELTSTLTSTLTSELSLEQASEPTSRLISKPTSGFSAEPSSFSLDEPHWLCDEELQALVGAVASVPDPELGGVTIGELGLVHEVRQSEVDGAIEVLLLPTFLGCPALKLMEHDVVAVLSAHSLGAGAGVAVRVTWTNSPTWNPTRISAAGCAKLAELGIAVPVVGSSVDEALPVCPICASAALEAKLPVGPTACRSVAWCTSCRSVVEIMRGSSFHASESSYANV
jgi:ring-1,2-phenylacetyl-CoA epoxidase subunit PaaD